MKTRINIYIEPGIYKKIKKIAEKNDRSVSSMINLILGEYIEAIKLRDKILPR